MDKRIFSNHDFVNRKQFFVAYDYEEDCMSQLFYKELYNLFRTVKSRIPNSYPHAFKKYLYAAHKACAFYSMFSERGWNSDTYPEMFEMAHQYICLADANEDCDSLPRPVETELFEPYEVYLIEYLGYAILSVQNNPCIPYGMIELYENQLAEISKVEENIIRLVTLRDSIPNNKVPDNQTILYHDWELTKKHFDESIREIARKYNREVTTFTKLYAYDLDLVEWSDEDLAQWICTRHSKYAEDFGIPQYLADNAKYILQFWEDSYAKQLVVQAIEEWSKKETLAFLSSQLSRIMSRGLNTYYEFLNNPKIDYQKLEADRAQAIKELYDYIEQDDDKDVENTAPKEPVEEPDQSNTPSAKLKLNPNKGPNNITNAVRIFNVMHELNFFSDAHGNKISKRDLGIALATIFNCPELSRMEWCDRLAASRNKCNDDDFRAQHKIFETMLKTQKDIINRLKNKDESLYCKKVKKSKSKT